MFTNVWFSSATVNWSSGTAAGGFNGPGASYAIQIATAPDFTGAVSSSVTYSLQVTTTGLASDTSYYFRVRAYNAGGMTDYSWYVLGSTMTQDNIPPSDISDLSAAPNADTSHARLTWIEPSSATVYEIRYSSTLPYVADSFETGLGNWENGGNLPWTVDATTHSGTGAQSIRAGGITHNQTSWIKRRVEGPFTLTFDWRVDSESGSDFLRFIVDGIETPLSLSGDSGWHYENYSIAAGSHTIEWRYTKDNSISESPDTGWVDNIVYREFWDLATVWNAARAVGGAAGFAESETVSGLLPNTGYYFGMKAKDGLDNWSEMSNMTSTYTFAAKPDTPLPAVAVYDPVYITSVTVNWSSGSVANGGWNPAGTLYYLEISTSSPDYYPVAASSGTYNLSAAVESLSPNTTYYARVRAVNSGGSVTDFAVLGATLTLAAMPGTAAGAAFLPVYTSSATVNFSSGTAAGGYNPSGTLFDAQLSTSADYVPVLVTSKTYNLSATLAGLSPNTTYYARARAMNFTSAWSDYIVLGSTLTMAAMPDLRSSDPVYKPVYVTSMTVFWSSGSAVNGGYNPDGTVYTTEVSVSSTNFVPLSGSTQTTSLSSVFTDLAPNTTYYSRARAQNGTGVLTDFKFLGSTSTLAIAPEAPAGTVFTPVYATTVTVYWSSGSVVNGYNPSDTLYTVEVSSYSNYSPVAGSSQTLGVSAALSGLSPDTTYYARVRAQNRIGVFTAYTALGSTITPAITPDLASGLAFTPVYASSATVSWSSGSVANGGYNPTGTLYRAELSTSSADYTPVAQSSQTYNLNATLTGLLPNTTYYGRAQALGRAGYTGYKVLGSTLTAAAVPGQPAGDLFSPIYSSSLTVNWSSGTSAGGYNPDGTRYYLELSTAPVTYYPAVSSQTYNLTAGLTGLAANTTYYARVRALNSANRASLFTILGSTATLTLKQDLPLGAVGADLLSGRLLPDLQPDRRAYRPCGQHHLLRPGAGAEQRQPRQPVHYPRLDGAADTEAGPAAWRGVRAGLREQPYRELVFGQRGQRRLEFRRHAV
ncbi:MAG: hypothetical protein A3J79_05370 [Elusimicrobia bacterium RIFOXYB2_FULL_62_6]|nr:MAG: hypothetical protein A3J79_05370 [Elusimicrobia bacterium RIFOXYB2_FULL_62_6]